MSTGRPRGWTGGLSAVACVSQKSPTENLTDAPPTRATGATGCDSHRWSNFFPALVPRSLLKGCARGVYCTSWNLPRRCCCHTRKVCCLKEFGISTSLLPHRIVCYTSHPKEFAISKSLLHQGCYVRLVISKSLLFQWFSHIRFVVSKSVNHQ